MTPQLLLVLGSIALLDSTSIIPLSVVPLAAILGGHRPLLGACAFLAGIFLVYLGLGLILLLGLDALFQFVGAQVAHRWRHPDTLDLVLQVILGAAMIVFAWKMANSRQSHGAGGASGSISVVQCFLTGAVLTVIGLPGAFPYFGAIDQILKEDPSLLMTVIALVFYNVMFVLPLACLVFIHRCFGKESEPFLQKVAHFSEIWGRRIIVSIIFLVGLALLIDGIGWFMGYPVLPVG